MDFKGGHGNWGIVIGVSKRKNNSGFSICRTSFCDLQVAEQWS
jgi:hypothetical protein